jgi:hypothetical protein
MNIEYTVAEGVPHEPIRHRGRAALVESIDKIGYVGHIYCMVVIWVAA